LSTVLLPLAQLPLHKLARAAPQPFELEGIRGRTPPELDKQVRPLPLVGETTPDRKSVV
jgi:hypothetical protein